MVWCFITCPPLWLVTGQMSLSKADSPHDSTEPCATKLFTGLIDNPQYHGTASMSAGRELLLASPTNDPYIRPSTSIPSFLTAQLLEVAADDSTSGLRVDRSAYLFCGASVFYTNIVVWKTPVANIGTNLPYLSCKLL